MAYGVEVAVTVSNTALRLEDITELAPFFTTAVPSVHPIVTLNVRTGAINVKRFGDIPTTEEDGGQLLMPGTYQLTGMADIANFRMIRNGDTDSLVHITFGG